MSTTPNTPATLTIPEKFTLMSDTLSGKVFERQPQIRTGILALVSKMHHIQVGLPGLAKTRFTEEMAKLIEMPQGALFEWQLSPFTTPSELFGPQSLLALKNDVQRVNTTNKLPEARIAFLDELFNCSSACLNTLLKIVNERVFFNDAVPCQVPLWSLFSGTNLIPTEPGLAAFWDRITFRMETVRLRDKGNREQMLLNRIQRVNLDVPVDPILTIADIEEAQTASLHVQVPQNVLNAFLGLIDQMFSKGIMPSDRRISDCMPIIQASAYCNGRSVASLDDLKDLRYVLWIKLEDRPIIDDLMLQLADPLDKAAYQLAAEIDQLSSAAQKIIDGTDDKMERVRKGLPIHGKLERARVELAALEAKAIAQGKKSSEIEEARIRLHSLVAMFVRELFDYEGV